MRPLTPEETAQVPKRAARLWRGVWFRWLELLALSFLLAILTLKSDPQFGWVLLTILFVAMPLYFIPWWVYWKWKRDLQADVNERVAEQKRGRVYDRFQLRSLLGLKTYVVWAEGADEGIDLHLDRSEFLEIQLGDTICVDYLSRTGLVVAARKVAAV